MDHYENADHVARVLAPSLPVLCHRPHLAARATRWFLDHFPGDVFYAVKANPDPRILSAMAAEDLQRFDVASIAEVRAVRAQFPSAELAFMHPIKSMEAIAEAYHDHGVRIFSLDHEEELAKIMAATGGAADLTLCIRLRVNNAAAEMPLANKFGARTDVALPLIAKARQRAERLALCFHAGSQSMDPAAFLAAMDHAETLAVRAGVVIDVVDVGGGFPALYPGMTPPALDQFIQAIAGRFDRFLATRNAALWCEPGRALVADCTSALLRVEARRDDQLYLNDGVYGALYDAGHFAWRYPVRAVRRSDATQADFAFYGPTCDDADHMPGPFSLPDDIATGDYIEVGMVGAYGRTMAAPFNGFGSFVDVQCTDDPFYSLFSAANDMRRAEG